MRTFGAHRADNRDLVVVPLLGADAQQLADGRLRAVGGNDQSAHQPRGVRRHAWIEIQRHKFFGLLQPADHARAHHRHIPRHDQSLLNSGSHCADRHVVAQRRLAGFLGGETRDAETALLGNMRGEYRFGIRLQRRPNA